jgi:MoaD family protein
MPKVKVKYVGTISELAGIRNEEITADSLEELLSKIGNKHKRLQEYLKLYEKETIDFSLIILYNHSPVRNIDDYKKELKDGDEVILMSPIAGG